MINIAVNEQKCLLSENVDCKKCVEICPMHVLGIRDGRIKPLRPEDCIACHCCKGACPAGLEVIEIKRPETLDELEILTLPRMSKNLETQIGTLSLRTPLIVASGPVGRCAQGWFRANSAGCGAVVTKSTTQLPWPGNPAIRIMSHGKNSVINCEGLPNRGVEATTLEIKQTKAINSELVVVPNITANTEVEFVDMARRFEEAGADAIEIALMGCPNYATGTRIAKRHWMKDIVIAAGLIRSLRKAVNIPLWIKVDQNLDIAVACEEEGADCLLVRQRSLRAMPVDPNTGRPLLSHPRGEGSLTGPYTKYPGLKIVADTAARVSIPIIANGGVACGQDVIDYFRAGASAVELLTVIIRRGMSIVPKILSELETYIQDQGLESLTEIQGQTGQFLAIQD